MIKIWLIENEQEQLHSYFLSTQDPMIIVKYCG